MYVRLSQFNCSTAFECAITNCHHLKHLYYGTDLWWESLTLPSSSNCRLRQLCIKSYAILSAPSVQVLSAHSGLKQVILFVSSITTSAITTLISNSPSLILLCIVTRQPLCDDNDAIVFPEDYKDTISKKFSNCKLLTTGDFILRVRQIHGWGYPSEMLAHFDTNFNSFW